MIRTHLPIRMVALGLVWASGCGDKISSPSLSETDEIETTDSGRDMPTDGAVEDGGMADAGVADSGPIAVPDSGPAPCPDGYLRIEGECTDVDECVTDNGGCGEIGSATCVNNLGAAPTCSDIDECLDNNGNCGDAANYECVNQDRMPPRCIDLNACGTDNGGCGDPRFNRCSYAEDGSVLCADIDECLVDNGGCGDPSTMTCVNPLNAKNTCADVNECSNPALNNCPDDKPCVNVKGGYFCGCEYPTIFEPATGTCRAVSVLVLDDGGGTTLATDLEAQGFTVVNGGRYYQWNQSPDLSGIDTVLWLEGNNYGNALLPGIDQLLVDFVKAGGGLVRSGMGLWYTTRQRNRGISVNPLTVPIMPVGLLSEHLLLYPGTDWTITNSSSPLAERLPTTSIGTTGGYTVLTLLPGSEMVASVVDARASEPVPTLSYTAIHGGVTVFVNDTLLFNTREELEPEIKQVYFNAVHFSAQRPLD